MSLITPDLIRRLQRKLYLKAKAEPEFRFHQLYDKVWRPDILAHAYALARSNAGAPGVDGLTFAMIEEVGPKEWLLSPMRLRCSRCPAGLCEWTRREPTATQRQANG